MTKKNFKKKFTVEDLEDYDDYGDLKYRTKKKRKERRFNRALKVKDLDELIENENYDEIWVD